jgi:peptidoglycan-associated lipoprotein
MKQFLSTITLFCLLLLLLQSCGWESSVKKGNQSYALGEYYDAAKYYKTAYSAIPSKERKKRGEIAYKMANCYRLTNYSVRAKGAYMNAIRYKYPDSIAFFYLAESLRKSADYKTAIKNYELYLSYKPSDLLARNGLKSCTLAPEWKNNPTRYIVHKFPIFNSSRCDYSPTYAGKETDQIYLTSTREKAKGNNLNGITGMKSADLFIARKNEKKVWQMPEALESEVNTEFEDGACSFTADGRTMYFTRCRIEPNAPVYAEIFVSQRSGANWGAPQKCMITKDSLSSVAHPAISPDGHYLYFTSDMPGGYGGKDIWRVPVSNSGFGAVENLGDAVNTPGDEIFPTIKDSGDLYFSSDGQPGMGGLDIFHAQQDKEGNWKIENMKSPINSQGDEFGMTFEPEQERGFFCSNRGDARGWDHIYTFELPKLAHTVNGWVYDKEGDALPESIVSIVGQDGTNLKVSVKGDGSFTQELKQGQSYVMLANCRGYMNFKQELTTDTVSENKDYELEFPLASINRPVLIDNIFYEFDKATLTNESTKALNELIKLLNSNPNVTIELSAHCDYKGSDSYNQELSQRRAESVVKFLIAGGIEKERLTAKGYGKSQPKIINKRLARKLSFFKEGDVLTEEFILKFPKEQQEICNAMNRRTEFKVLRTTYKLYK